MPRDEKNYWQRMNSGRFSRRRVLQGGGALGAGAAGLALVGCGNDDDDENGVQPTPGTGDDDSAPQPTPDSGEVTQGGHFNASMDGSPRSLDFHFDTFPYNTFITTNTNNGVLKFSSDLSEIEPDLGEGLPENPDELTWVFKIRQDVQWQDIEPVNGRQLTAEDVAYSLNRQMTDEAGVFQHAYFFLGHVERFEAQDDETLVAVTNAPYAPFLSYMASPWTLIANREAVEQYGDLTEHAVGTGPFIFREWQHDVRVDFDRNPNYFKQDEHGNQLPHIDSFTIHIIPDQDTRATQFIDGQLDAATAGEATFGRIQNGRPNANYANWPSQFWRQFRMQPTMPDQPYREPFDDPRVRQAVVQAHDAQEILDLVYNGDGVLTNGPILPQYEFWALPETPEGARYDPANARALLEQAGNPTVEGDLIWADTSPQLQQVAELHQAHLADIGVNARLQGMELASYYNQTYAYDYVFSSHTPLNNPDPDENLASYFGRNAAFFKFHDEDIWEIIDRQATILDLEERREVVLEAQRMIVEAYPMKFLYTTNIHGFTGSNVHNWFYSLDLYNGRIETIWLSA
jgi:peptide/nickel transport system substrate-binding protein